MAYDDLHDPQRVQRYRAIADLVDAVRKGDLTAAKKCREQLAFRMKDAYPSDPAMP